MAEYQYKVDTLERMWRRSWVHVEADSQEEADKEIRRIVQDCPNEIEADWSEDLIDTAEQITVLENECNPTVEIFKVDNGDKVWDNSPTRKW